MALIKCPECKKEISDKADSCINCGYPLITLAQNNQITIKAEKRTVLASPTLTIYLYDEEGNCVANVLEGHTIYINIMKPTNLYASFVKPSGHNYKIRSTSNPVKVFPDKKTKLKIDFKNGFVSTNLTMNEVSEY